MYVYIESSFAKTYNYVNSSECVKYRVLEEKHSEDKESMRKSLNRNYNKRDRRNHYRERRKSLTSIANGNKETMKKGEVRLTVQKELTTQLKLASLKRMRPICIGHRTPGHLTKGLS